MNKLREVDRSISRGVAFLTAAQLSNGEFRMFASQDEHTMIGAGYDSTPFTTTFVLHTLGLVDSGVVEMIERGLGFLAAEEESGLWRYWSRSDSKHSSIPPRYRRYVLRFAGIASVRSNSA